MAVRVRIASEGWGVVQDTFGNAQQLKTATITDLDGGSVPVYAAASGDTLQSPIRTNARGEIPGFIEPGTYLVTVGDVVAAQVEAGAGTVVAPPPLGFADGAFVRLQSGPIVDRSSANRGFRDPAIYAEDRGTNRH